MPKLTIDGRSVTVPDGATVLDAARAAGVDIPTLCHLDGHPPNTSCYVCVVRVNGQRWAPSCATRAEDGWQVESETPDVSEMRKGALELLLSDHDGCCLSPCQLACPGHLDISHMVQMIAEDNLGEAIATARGALALPGVLGYICPKPCEAQCPNRQAGGSVSVCLLKRHVAEEDLAHGCPALPACAPATGKRVAIVGTGPTGLSAAFHLLRAGVAVTLFDEHDQAGGALRYAIDEERLPRRMLDGEIELITRLGATLRLGVRIGRDLPLAEVQRTHDAVLLALGTVKSEVAGELGLKVGPQGLVVNKVTLQTSMAGVFAAGGAVKPSKLAVRSVGDGQRAAACIAQCLGLSVGGPAPTVPADLPACAAVESALYSTPRRSTVAGTAAARLEPATRAGFTIAEARAEAQRCLHCGCDKARSCLLRRHAVRYDADPKRFKGTQRRAQPVRESADLRFEPGKCIACGLCVQLAREAGEPLGLAFAGRGFDLRLVVPFDGDLGVALSRCADQAVAACPTGALSHRA